MCVVSLGSIERRPDHIVLRTVHCISVCWSPRDDIIENRLIVFTLGGYLVIFCKLILLRVAINQIVGELSMTSENIVIRSNYVCVLGRYI